MFCVSGGYCGIILSECELFWVGGGVIGHYFRWLGGGDWALIWVGEDEWGWVQYLIMPSFKYISAVLFTKILYLSILSAQ